MTELQGQVLTDIEAILSQELDAVRKNREAEHEEARRCEVASLRLALAEAEANHSITISHWRKMREAEASADARFETAKQELRRAASAKAMMQGRVTEIRDRMRELGVD